jgi:hypothetical protein
MFMGRIEKVTNLVSVVLGTVIGAAILYFTMAPLFEWWPTTSKAPLSGAPITPPSEIIPSAILWIFGLLALALIATGWIPKLF